MAGGGRYLGEALDTAESLIAMKNKEAEDCRAPETFEVRSTNLYPRLCIGVWAGSTVLGILAYVGGRASDPTDATFVSWLFWGLGLILLAVGLWMKFQHFVVTPDGIHRKFGKLRRKTYPWTQVTEARLIKHKLLALYHGDEILFGVSPEMRGFFWLLQTVKRRKIPVKIVKKIPFMDYIKG